MTDATNTAIDAAADTAKAAIKAASATAKSATETSTTAAKRVAKAATTATKKTATKKTNRRAKAQRRTRRPARKPEAAAAKERTKDVNFNPNNWLAQFGAPAAPFQSMFAEAGDRGQEAARRSQQATEELADLTRANVEALADAGRIAAEGARSIGHDVVETSREGIEQAADAVRSLAAAKSATEFVQIQGEFARASFDRAVSESSRLTESLVKLAGEAFQPLSNRASVNAERINKLVA